MVGSDSRNVALRPLVEVCGFLRGSPFRIVFQHSLSGRHGVHVGALEPRPCDVPHNCSPRALVCLFLSPESCPYCLTATAGVRSHEIGQVENAAIAV